jgi:hypothetical protein
VPADPFAVAIGARLAAAVDVVDVVEDAAGAAAAVLEFELLALPHPAMTIAEIASAARPPPRTFIVLRLAIARSRFEDFHRTRYSVRVTNEDPGPARILPGSEARSVSALR